MSAPVSHTGPSGSYKEILPAFDLETGTVDVCNNAGYVEAQLQTHAGIVELNCKCFGSAVQSGHCMECFPHDSQQCDQYTEEFVASDTQQRGWKWMGRIEHLIADQNSVHMGAAHWLQSSC